MFNDYSVTIMVCGMLVYKGGMLKDDAVSSMLYGMLSPRGGMLKDSHNVTTVRASPPSHTGPSSPPYFAASM